MKPLIAVLNDCFSQTELSSAASSGSQQKSLKLQAPLQPVEKTSGHSDPETDPACVLRILKHFPRTHIVARKANAAGLMECKSGIPQRDSPRVALKRGDCFPASQGSITSSEGHSLPWQQRSPATSSDAADSQGSEESWFLLEVVGFQQQQQQQHQDKLNKNTKQHKAESESIQLSPVTPKVSRARTDLSTPSKRCKLQ